LAFAENNVQKGVGWNGSLSGRHISGIWAYFSGDSLSVAERAWRQMLQVKKEEAMRACIEHGRLSDAVKTIWASTSGNMKLRRIQQIIQVYAHPLRVFALGFSAGSGSESAQA